MWEDVQTSLQDAFTALGLKIRWIRMAQFLLPAEETSQLVKPFLGQRNSVWGTKTTLQLQHFFRMHEIAALKINKEYDCTVFLVVARKASYQLPPVTDGCKCRR